MSRKNPLQRRTKMTSQEADRQSRENQGLDAAARILHEARLDDDRERITALMKLAEMVLDTALGDYSHDKFVELGMRAEMCADEHLIPQRAYGYVSQFIAACV
jgi:hypothetical protein